MLILQIRLPPTIELVSPFFSLLARFFRSPPNAKRVPPFFSSLARFFRSPPTTEAVSPHFFLARPPISLAPNYRESAPPPPSFFFSSNAPNYREPGTG